MVQLHPIHDFIYYSVFASQMEWTLDEAIDRYMADLHRPDRDMTRGDCAYAIFKLVESGHLNLVRHNQ